MKKIAVANRKGGVGKTTISSHIAAGLAIRGKNVLLIDTDSQGHAAVSLGLKKEPGVFRLLADDVDFQEVLRMVLPSTISVPDNPPAGKLFILPSNERTHVIPMVQPNPLKLAERLEEIEHVFDYMIIDTGPTTTMFDSSVYLAADGVIYVTECEKLAFDGLQTGLRQVKEFAQQRKGYDLAETKVLGIIPNRFRETTKNHTKMLEFARQAYGELIWDAIPLSTVLSECSNHGKSVFAYAPSAPIAAQMFALSEKLESVVMA